LAFGPDGSLLASGGRGGVVSVWDTATGERFATLPAPGDEALPDVTSLAIHPGGVVVAAGDAGGAIRLWDLPTGEAVTELAAGAGAVTRLAFDADGARLAAGLDDGRVRVWDLAAGDAIANLDGSAGAVTGLAFLPGGETLAVGDAGGALRLWDVPGGEARQLGDGATAVLHLAASPDGAILAAALDDGTLRLWDVASGDVRAALQPPEEGGFTRVAFVSGGAVLAAGTAGGSLTVWDVESGELIALLHGHDGAVTGLDASASGDLIATGGADRAIRLWRVPPEDDAALAGDPAVGETLFAEAGCAACHTSEPDAPGVGPMLEVMAREAGARVPELTAHEYLVLSITQPHTTIVDGFPTLMPEFDLTGQEISDLIAYIQTFR
jgi:WD40 repeat protein